MHWMHAMSLTAIGAIIFLGLLAAFEFGIRLRRWLRRFERAGEDTPDHLLAAVLGLLALLLGFTFSLALNRYDARRLLVVEEANALGTVWLRADLLAEPARSAMQVDLRRYIDARVKWSEIEEGQQSWHVAQALQSRIWDEVRAVEAARPGAHLTRAIIDSVNESFDLASARHAARADHLPARVLTILLLYMALSAMMMGYVMAGKAKVHRVATAQLLALLMLAMILILDLDRPRSGGIQVRQTPLEELQAAVAPD